MLSAGCPRAILALCWRDGVLNVQACRYRGLVSLIVIAGSGM